MRGAAENGFDRPDLGDLAEIHHHHAVAHVAHHVQVVGDEQIGEAEFLLQVQQQVQHLRLDRLVQRGNRFVEDHDARLERQRAGDVDALALAAGELVRVARGIALRREAHPGEQFARTRFRLPPRQAVHDGSERDRILDRQARIERSEGVLEHHLHLPAHVADRHPVRRRFGDAFALEQHAPGIGLDQAHQQARGGRLAAAGFADNAERLARHHRERDVVHSVHRARALVENTGAQREILAQFAHFKNGPRVFDRVHWVTSIAARRPSDIMLKQIDTMKIIAPGSAATPGLR